MSNLFSKYVLCPLRLSSPVALVHQHDSLLAKLVMKECPSLFGPEAYYTPPIYLAGGNLPTCFAAVADFSKVDNILYERQYIRVPDGGTLSLDWAPTFAECSVTGKK